MNEATLAIRVNQDNLDHHLWNNHGTWWCQFTLHLPDCTKRRVRRSLETKSLVQARDCRDSLLASETRGESAVKKAEVSR